MDLELTEAQRGARDTARRFAARKTRTDGVETDRTHRFPAAAIAELASSGCSASSSPRNTAARASTMLRYALVVEELAVECASTAVIVSAHSSLASWPILGLGNDRQKDHFLPKMATGEWIGCFALTEPQAGSDAAGQKTKAVRDGDYLRHQRHQEFHHQRAAERRRDRVRDDRRPTRAITASARLRSRPRRPDGRSRGSKTRWEFTARTARSSASPT